MRYVDRQELERRLGEIRAAAERGFADVADLKAFEEMRVNIFGKRSELTAILKSLGALSQAERPAAGQLINGLREELERLAADAKTALSERLLKKQLYDERIDVTMPGKAPAYGHKHPITRVLDDLKNIFIGMGYEIAEGPEVETDYYNFEALNIPANHPAKDEQDTFYTEGGFVLRTQTSPVQVRTLEKGELPIRIIAPGRVYRSDEVDATHSPVFHQVEGLVVDRGVTMGDLKGSLQVFAEELFGKGTRVRFRPHHFPFTEPSAEMDASCFACGGTGCHVCKDSGWIEMLGCGMVHPKVLRMSGVDPDIYSGFAFGMGVERIAMQRYGITDMRLLYENDVKFLRQF